MAVSVSYSHAREHLAEIWNEIEDTRDVAVIQRRGHEDMALIPAGELASLRETAYLLDRIRSEDRNQVASEYLSLHPEGLRVSASRPEPDHEYRRPYHHDYDHDYDRDRRDDRRDRDR